MRRILLPSLMSLFFAFCVFAADEPKGRLNLTNFDMQHILPLYKEMSGLELVIDSRVKTVHSTITLHTSEAVPKAEAMRLIEKVLLEQAGVVITRLEGHRASMTYNDALPIVAAKKPLRQ